MIIVGLMIASLAIFLFVIIRLIYSLFTDKDGMNSSRFVNYKSYV